MKNTTLLVLCVLIASILHAQSITGVWRGYFYSGLGFYRQQYKYEVQFNQLKNKSLQGVTYSYSTTSFYGKARLKGIYQNTAKSVIMKEDSLIEVRGSMGQICLFTCYLDYSKEGDKEILQGNYTSVVADGKADCGSGIVYLEKVDNSDFTKESFLQKKSGLPVTVKPKTPTPPTVTATPKRVDTTKLSKPPVVALPRTDTVIRKIPAPLPVPPALKERQNELVRTIITNSPEIKVDLYDNGDIDGDTITVYHNNRVVAFKKGLSTEAITLSISASAQENKHEFVMYANNLGKIPPNTALMVITTGGKRYELAISSNKEKNAKVIIEYQPNQD